MQMQAHLPQESPSQQGQLTPSLFDDKGGLARFGGMAASITAVAQVAEQFTGHGFLAAFGFSFVVAVYFSKKAFQLDLLDCLVWVPIYTCVIFVTALGSNNLVGLSEKKETITLTEHQEQVSFYEGKLKEFEETIKAQNEVIGQYQKLKEMLKTKFSTDPTEEKERTGQVKQNEKGIFLSRFLLLFLPRKAYAQEGAISGTTPTLGPKEADRRDILQLLNQIERTEEKLREPPTETEKKKPPEIKIQEQRKIWQKW